MQTHRLFIYLQRFNTLLPAAAALLLVGALGWATLADKRASTRQTVDPPAGSAGKAAAPGEPLQIRSSQIDAGPNTLVMKIVAPKTGGGRYDGESLETRNLLFLNEGADQAHWLFADASQAITEIQALGSEAKPPMALYLETVSRPAQAGQHATSTAYLVSPDGLRKRAIASELDTILSHRQHGQTLQLVYQKGKAVRAMRVSLQSFEMQSDRAVASLSEVGH